jgi:hypothetical protein
LKNKRRISPGPTTLMPVRGWARADESDYPYTLTLGLLAVLMPVVAEGREWWLVAVLLPAALLGLLGSVLWLWPPSRPRRVGRDWHWSTRRVRLARLAIDGGIGVTLTLACVSLAGAAVVVDPTSGWSWFVAVVLIGCAGFVASYGVAAVGRPLRPGVRATLTPTPDGWQIIYHVGRAPAHGVAVTLLEEHRWQSRRRHNIFQHRCEVIRIQTLARHPLPPATGRVRVEAPARGVTHRYLIFRSGRGWWRMHESVRLPDDANLRAGWGGGSFRA